MEELDIICPCCWQSITVYLDSDIGDEKITIVDDCTVCCRPIEITYAIVDGEISSYGYHAIDGN